VWEAGHVPHSLITTQAVWNLFLTLAPPHLHLVESSFFNSLV